MSLLDSVGLSERHISGSGLVRLSISVAALLHTPAQRHIFNNRFFLELDEMYPGVVLCVYIDPLYGSIGGADAHHWLFFFFLFFISIFLSRLSAILWKILPSYTARISSLLSLASTATQKRVLSYCVPSSSDRLRARASNTLQSLFDISIFHSHTVRKRLKLTLEDESTHPNGIVDIPLPLQHVHQIAHGQIIPSLRVLCKNLFEFRRYKPPLRVVRACITTMSRSMHIIQKETEVGVRKPPRARGIGEVDVDDQYGEGGEEQPAT